MYVCGGRAPGCTTLWLKWQSVIRHDGVGGGERTDTERRSEESWLG